jgi:hypothetical protein
MDDLDGSLAEAWRLLARGVVDRRSPMHNPTVATVGADGPNLRTVVLRGVDVPARQLRFHTDRRSAKVAEIAADPRIHLHAYDPGAKVQLRLAGHATLHHDDAIADAAWAASRAMSRVCYGTEPAPGSAITTPDAFRLPAEDATDPGRVHFAAVVIHVARLEWLYLAFGGHRRALFTWADGALTARWLAP